MAKIKSEEMGLMNQLANSLTPENVHELQEMLGIPSEIVEISGASQIDFLIFLKFDFPDFNPSVFLESLNRIGRNDLVPIARKLPWIKSTVEPSTATVISPSVESFVRLLKNEIKTSQWKIILSSGLSVRVTHDLNFETAVKESIEGGLISPDLGELCDVMTAIEKYDIVEQVQTHASVFHGMNKTEFQSKLMDELESTDRKEQENWVIKLREYTKQQNEKVYLRFDDDEAIPLESVYTPLTVVEEIIIQSSEDTSLNEIDFLRKMSQKEKSLKAVDLISIICNIDSNTPTVLCLIGNPGSGKSFLCKYLALLYGTNELTNFEYVLLIHCRNEEWHEMEKSREEKEEKVNESFEQNWLSLAMPVGIRWSKSLAKNLSKSGGEGLLLIIDGADEFIKDVSFKTTLLYSLLQKRSLNRSTVLLTSRPGAWSNIREEHGQELNVDTNYQVLGFSPSDRDTYFKKRISTADKLRDTKQLFFLHDEINQLSLVPVNASLFSSLFNETTNILSQTLTNLYTELIIYIIRRQLSRMGLKRLTRVHRMSQFHPSIWQCISAIAYEAYEGIFHRELSSREEDMSIRINGSEYATEQLGLMQLHVKVLKLGQRVNVWTFAHLTLQEYMAAVYLGDINWSQECVIMRFLVSSESVFAMYKMVVRFLCGILGDRAACLIPIICNNLIPDTMWLVEEPMIHQLYYHTNLVNSSELLKFVESFLLISSVIVETNSRIISNFFHCLRDLLPDNVYLYFANFVSPNEWQCFLLSLYYIRNLQILYIRTYIINPTQFSSLLHRLSSCSLSYLALAFHNEDYRTIQSYTSLLSAGTPIQYKISISLIQCVLTDMYPSLPLFSTQNQFIGSIRLYKSKISNQNLTQLTIQFSCIENMYYAPKQNYSEMSIIYPLLSNNREIKGLSLHDPNSILPVIPPEILHDLSSLQELYWSINDPYTILPYLLLNSKLTSLKLYSPSIPPIRKSYRYILTEVIRNNSNYLREIDLSALNTIGFDNLTSILSSFQSCHKLVRLSLINCPFTPNDISYWYTAISYLQALADLIFVAIPMGDSGLMILCKSLNLHPAIRNLTISKCKLTSDSCEPIAMLIHTLPHLRRLKLHKSELSFPDSSPLYFLLQTAEILSVKIEYRN